MTAFNGYPFSILVALALHALVLASVLFMQRTSTQALDVVRPPVVKAVLVQENPQTRNERAQQQRQAQQRAEQQRLEEQRQLEEQRRRDQEARQQEEQRQAALRRQQEEREQQQREQDAERRRLEEQQRREQDARAQQEQRLAEERQRQEEAQRQARLESEARERAETDAEYVMGYSAVIHDLVQQNWSRPPSARNNMVAVLRIRMVPTGDVTDVSIIQTSGDRAFDDAAVRAVRAVGRFSELQGMPPRLFERNFREFLLTFRPEDLLN